MHSKYVYMRLERERFKLERLIEGARKRGIPILDNWEILTKAAEWTH